MMVVMYNKGYYFILIYGGCMIDVVCFFKERVKGQFQYEFKDVQFKVFQLG